jgi:WD40 repeat protein
MIRVLAVALLAFPVALLGQATKPPMVAFNGSGNGVLLLAQQPASRQWNAVFADLRDSTLHPAWPFDVFVAPTALALSADGNLAHIGAADGRLAVVDSTHGSLRQILTLHESAIVDSETHVTHKLHQWEVLLTADDRGIIRLWKTGTEELLREYLLEAPALDVEIHDQETFVVLTRNGDVFRHSLEVAVPGTLLSTTRATSISASPLSPLVLIGNADGSVQQYDSDLERLGGGAFYGSLPVRSVLLLTAPRFHQVLTGANLLQIDTTSELELDRLPGNEQVAAIYGDPAGNRLVVVRPDGRVTIHRISGLWNQSGYALELTSLIHP